MEEYIECPICTDLLKPTSDIYCTTCGHVFHFICLVQWLGRSDTCPQCRGPTTRASIFRMDLNFGNTEEDKPHAPTFELEVDELRRQVFATQKFLNTCSCDSKCTEEMNVALRKQVLELRDEVAAKQALTEQLQFLERKAKDCKERCHEYLQLKKELQKMELLEAAINGTGDQVNEMLSHHVDPHFLNALVAVLKSELVEADAKQKDTNLMGRDASRCKADLFVHVGANHRLQSEWERCKIELLSLREKIRMVAMFNANASCVADVNPNSNETIDDENSASQPMTRK